TLRTDLDLEEAVEHALRLRRGADLHAYPSGVDHQVVVGEGAARVLGGEQPGEFCGQFDVVREGRRDAAVELFPAGRLGQHRSPFAAARRRVAAVFLDREGDWCVSHAATVNL